MRTAVFGGSFDPPHVGHVLATQYLLSIDVVDRVLVVPVFDHAHLKELRPFAVRLRLCEAAFDFDSRVEVSAIESELPRPSYTLRTLEELAKRERNSSFRLVVGSDVMAEKDKWYRFDRVEEIAPPFVLFRAGYESKGTPRPVLPEVSSRDLRKCLKRRSPEDIEKVELLIPAKVRRLIQAEGLYR